MTAIVADGLAKRYGALPVLRDLTLDVEAGEVYGLLQRQGPTCLLGRCEGFFTDCGAQGKPQPVIFDRVDGEHGGTERVMDRLCGAKQARRPPGARLAMAGAG